LVYLSIIKKIRDMKELSGIEKMELAKATMEGLGFDFSTMTVAEAFEMFRAIKSAVNDTLAAQKK
jgi:hypothetical protein